MTPSKRVLALGAGGDSIETLLEDYPNVTREDIDAALGFASALSDFQEASYESIG